MPIELAAAQPVQIPAPITLPVRMPVPRKQTLVFTGQLLAVLLLTGLWVGVQCVYLAAAPSEAHQSIAGP